MEKSNLTRHAISMRKNFKNEHNVLSDSKVKRNEENFQYKTIKTIAGARWHEIGKVKQELKEMLPKLTSSEIRRFHLPFHEAVILELEEDGYKESVNYLKELFELDEKTRTEVGSNALISKELHLKDSENAIIRLKEGLIAFEQAKNAGNSMSMTMAFLNMAIYFLTIKCEWLWLIERLYCSALLNAELIQNDQQTITLINYLYGRFLFEQMQDTEKSVYYLKIARGASKKKSWNASKITGEKEESIFQECNILLYKALLMQAQQKYEQPDIVAEACTEALARATDSEHREYIAKALHELGKSQLQLGNIKLALRNFSELLAIVKRIPDPEGVCNAHMMLAFTYKKLNDKVNAEKHFRLLRENAAEFGFTEKLAQAHYYTGEHFLNKKRPYIATFHLEKSFNLYNEIGLYDDANRSRTMAGVSKGQEIIDQYIDLMLQCETGNLKAISMLCQWKNSRSIWTEKKLDAENLEQLASENFDETTFSSPTVSTNITSRQASSKISSNI